MTLRADYLEVLARNEGGDPFRLSDAYHNDLEYGLSFGRKQVDLFTFTGNGGTVPTASAILARILTAAAANGVVVAAQDIADVAGGILHHKAADVRVTRADLIDRINAVLLTPQGQAALNAEEGALIDLDLAAATARAAKPGSSRALLSGWLGANLI
jgi:hypothetical protein